MGVLTNVIWGFVVVFVCLSIAKFGVGLHYINKCPADNKIPEFMVENSCVVTVIDILVGLTKLNEVKGFLNTIQDDHRITVIVADHLISMIIATVYVGKPYPYLNGVCDGADVCCNQNLIRFALGVVITEWILCFLVCLFLC
ncbi:uncharacterized protein LOC132730365 [Ruditapes philippinarum]|uniref:uncharacterized protein LOC132730365 n=1 Tax=Ruditapes philippinarum TaxID=129788 RepID=UPI00295B1A97|nr:uncharacterized protein LOC132730365 [Ruditapes philippinarum]